MTRSPKTFVFVLWALAWASSGAYGEPVFYLSADPIGVATPPDPTDTLLVQSNVGGTLNLYVMTDVRMSEIRVHVTNVGSAIEFTGLHVANENLRWTFVAVPTVVPDEIRNIGGGAIPGVSGNGVGPASPDPGFDPTSGYLIATLNYAATDNLGTTSDLFIKSERAYDWDGNLLAVRFGGPNHDLTPGNAIGATDALLDFRIRVVPEPGSMVLAGLASLGLATVMHRRHSERKLTRS